MYTRGVAMNIDKLLNDYSIIGDGGETIFLSIENLMDFVEEIRADERQSIVDKIKENK